MNIDFRLLGWKAFQDLCVAVASEVLQRPVQVFLPSKDGGRDGAFVGTWKGAPDEPANKSTIQCKFSGKNNATLTPSQLVAELAKVKSLAARGLAHDYIIMTNAGVSGDADAQICAAFEKAGAKQCRVFGGDWLAQEIEKSARLRMMVPRLYGIGDLTQILDDRAYTQARHILSAMGDDLSCFVTTAAHRQGVEAMTKHGFVLLLGDPASGKSTIAAILALGALDAGSVGAVRITSPDQLSRWNPHEKQFLWVDDAFGPSQFDPNKTAAWNAQLPLLRSALKRGSRIVFTSRNYIWEAARRALKTSEFPLFQASQVIIDVQGLLESERGQILYNHIKLGGQPKEFKSEVKNLLATVAGNSNFLPEIARRLASPFFTGSIELTADGLRDFVDHPVDFLKEVLEKLDRPAQAAIALIFLHGNAGVLSPIAPTDELGLVTRLFGESASEIARALELLNGSLTLLVEHPEGRRWSFRHPTIADAFSVLVTESPELVELYVRGAKLDRLMDEVVCGAINVQGANVRVPAVFYSGLVDRLKDHPLDGRVQRFLTSRCDRDFVELYLSLKPEFSMVVSKINSGLAYDPQAEFLAHLASLGLLPETARKAATERVEELAFTWMDAGVFSNSKIRQLFTPDEFGELEERFKREVLDDLDSTVRRWGEDYSSTNMASHFRELRENLEIAQSHFKIDIADASFFAFSEAYERIDEQIANYEAKEESDEDSGGQAIASPIEGQAEDASISIFDDIDE